MTNLSIAFIGAGRLGGALALALSKKGYEIKQLVSRNSESAVKIAALIPIEPEIIKTDELNNISSDLIFITTPDSEIQTTTENLARNLKHQPFVFHTSGALSSDVLHPLREIGCQVASLHPLVSISDSQLGAERFKDVFFCIEGDAAAVELANQIVSDLEGKPFSIATKYKSLYHASAVMTSGHLVALFSVAVESLAACGLDEREAQEILFPLIRSTVDNLATQTPAEALTGTFSRGDVETLKRHLKSLSENVLPEVINIYRKLGIRSLHLAEKKGTSVEKIEQMKELLRDN